MSYSSQCAYGELFGLKSTDLTNEQLLKISMDKLIECVDYDSRVFDRVCAVFLQDPVTNIGMFIKLYKSFDQWDSKNDNIKNEIKSKVWTAIVNNPEWGRAVVDRLIYVGF